MLSLTRWLIVALAVFAVGGVSLAQPLEVEVARSSLPNKPRFTLSDHKDVVWCVAFSPDGKSLVTCSGNRDAKAGEIRGYDLSSGKPVHKFLVEESHGIRWLSFAPDGKTLATAEYDGTVKFRDASTGKVLTKFEAHPGGVQCLKFAPDGKTLVTCGKDNTAKVWDVATKKATMTMKGHSNHVYSLDLLFDRHTLLTGSNDSTAVLWDVATGESTGTVPGTTNPVEVVRFSPDGNYFAVAGWDGIVIIWSTETENHVSDSRQPRRRNSRHGVYARQQATGDRDRHRITASLAACQPGKRGVRFKRTTATSAVSRSPRTAS